MIPLDQEGNLIAIAGKNVRLYEELERPHISEVFF